MNVENNKKTNIGAFELLLIFLSLGGIFNFIIFYILGARAKDKTNTLIGHFYLGGFVLISLYKVLERFLHPFFMLIYCLLFIASYILGFLMIVSSACEVGDRLLLLKDLDDFALKNKDIYAMSNEEIKNFIAVRNPQAIQKPDSGTVKNKTAAENTKQVSTKPKIMINSISSKELSTLPFFNSSFAEEAVYNRNSGIFFNNIEDLKEFLHIDDQSAVILGNLVTFDIKEKNPTKSR